MRLFGVLNIVRFLAWIFVSTAVSTPVHAASLTHPWALRCEALLSESKDALIEKGRKGIAIHELNRKHWELNPTATRELDLDDVSEIIAKNAYTSAGRSMIEWTLAHPRLDSQKIREVQAAIEELHRNPELRKALQQGLDGIRKFETNQLWGDRVKRVLLKFLGFKGQPEDRNIDLRLKSLAERPDLFERLNRGLFLLGMPTMAAWLHLTPKPIHALYPMVAGLATIMAEGLNSGFRFQLRPLTYYVKAMAASAKVLSSAQSSHLRDLGQMLEAVSDSKHPLKVRGLSQILSRMTTSGWAGMAIDSTLVGNLYVPATLEVTQHKLHRLMILMSVVSEIDALQSFSRLYEHPEFHRPVILDESDPVQLHIGQGHHPLLVLQGKKSVPNDTHLTQDSEKQLVFLTGGNTNGKTTYVRMIALASVLAQSGLPVPAESVVITPLTILSAIQKEDSTFDDVSSFRAEARRIGVLLKQLNENPRNLVIIDEVFSGTSAEEKDVAERALLKYLAKRQALALVSSHNRSLIQLESTLPGFQNFHPSDEKETRFQIQAGSSKYRNAIEVLKEEGLPQELIDEATK